MLKLFIVCAKRSDFLVKNLNNELGDYYEVIEPASFETGEENSENFKIDIENVRASDIILVLGGYLSLFHYAEIYEAYRSKKPIYTLSDIMPYKVLSSILGIEYRVVHNLKELSLSRFVDLDKRVQESSVDNDCKLVAREILNKINVEPLLIVENNEIIFDWESDPEKVDYCKYSIRLRVLKVDDKLKYGLKVMYYDEVVCDYIGIELDSYILRVNKYIEDFGKLSR